MNGFAPRWFLMAGFFFLAAMSVGIVSAPVARAQTAPPPEVWHWLATEKNANVGKRLPADIKVMDARGKSESLRQALGHGPAVIIKLADARTTRTVQRVVKAIRTTGGKVAGNATTRLVVLRVGQPAPAPLKLPASVLQLFSTDDMESGFLGGHISPTTFYFDQDLRLIKRVLGWPRKGNPMAPSKSRATSTTQP